MIRVSYTDDLLDSYREKQDALADEVIRHYFPKKKSMLQKVLSGIEGNDYQPNKNAPEVFKNLWKDVYKNEVLGDDALLRSGQQFFSKNSSDLMLLLGFLSLPYCYAAARGAEVLIRSNRIKADPENRLLETAQFVFDVMAPEAFSPEGKALASILKVRLMHAAIRYYISQDTSWQINFGKPINQEDQAGTNLSFSLIPIRGLRKLGRRVSGEESKAYIGYWNIIGRLLGLAPELLPDSNKAANVLERKIRKRQFEASEAGRALTSSLLDYFERATQGTELEGRSKPFVHFLLGDAVAGMLDIDIDELTRKLFQPIPQLMKLKNTFISKDDRYLNSLHRFREQRAALANGVTFDLPKAIGVASGAS
jgi:hypothetical protein